MTSGPNSPCLPAYYECGLTAFLFILGSELGLYGLGNVLLMATSPVGYCGARLGPPFLGTAHFIVFSSHDVP